MVALESTAMMTPSLKTKASVVVPTTIKSSTCFEVHDLLLLSIGALDVAAEFIGFIDGCFSDFLLVFIEVVVLISIELAAQIGRSKAHNLVVHLNIF
jgi:hypothetical protein